MTDKHTIRILVNNCLHKQSRWSSDRCTWDHCSIKQHLRLWVPLSLTQRRRHSYASELHSQAVVVCCTCMIYTCILLAPLLFPVMHGYIISLPISMLTCISCTSQLYNTFYIFCSIVPFCIRVYKSRYTLVFIRSVHDQFKWCFVAYHHIGDPDIPRSLVRSRVWLDVSSWHHPPIFQLLGLSISHGPQ